jgi:pyruvate/2-oxoglutarate dehydrogenase complex dihydrolipoamide dehydrogenase (E3) component
VSGGPKPYDLVVIGAGSGGLVAADFAARLGANVALVEGHRIGGDCTWTGCVPSKALLKAARVAHDVRAAGRYGIEAGPPTAHLGRVRDYVQSAIATVYAAESPDVLRQRGIDVVEGHAEFTSAQAISVGGRTLAGRRFLICAGARAAVPPITGLGDVPYLTYEQVFDNDRLPSHLLVLGAGPIGLELALAYRRLGADVTVLGQDVLPCEEPEVRAFVAELLVAEGIRLVLGSAQSARRDGAAIVVESTAGPQRGDLLLVATGRRPNSDRLALEKAGVAVSGAAVVVDRHLRTSQRHIFAAGDVTGGAQFTHYAAWQAFQATRNALLPGSAAGVTDLVPRVTFLDPEIAHVGLGEADARRIHGDHLRVHRKTMATVDRAVADGDTKGFLTIVTGKGDRLIGATAVAARAGELIAELALAMRHKLTLADVAGTIHPYPTWATGLQQLAADVSIERFLSSGAGRLALRLSGFGKR